MEPDEFRSEAFVYYKSIILGTEIGQSFEFRMVT
jgi:hypothetical protein